MIARISTRVPSSKDELWRRILDPVSLQFVASPIMTFVPANKDGGVPDTEQPGVEERLVQPARALRLRSGEKAWVFATEPVRVVYIPTRRGYSLLVSESDPDEFPSTLGTRWEADR